MSEAKYLDRAREAGLYLQKFVRSKHDDFAEAFREMHPNQGWNGKGVREAHNAVAMLYHFTDEKFLNCRIPEDYGSPAALRSAVVELQGMMSVLKKEIENIKPSKKEFLAETVPIAHEHIEATRSCPLAWCSSLRATTITGLGREDQAARVGRLTRGSSPIGAMLSRVM